MSPRRRHKDTPSGPQRRREDKLEELLEHGSRNFRRYRRRALWGFVLLTVLSAFALYRVDAAADRAAELAIEIQSQRVDSIRTACINQNRRHDATIEALDTLIDKLPPSKQSRARMNRAGTVLLIEALQPRQDCEALVRRSAPSPTP